MKLTEEELIYLQSVLLGRKAFILYQNLDESPEGKLVESILLKLRNKHE